MKKANKVDTVWTTASRATSDTAGQRFNSNSNNKNNSGIIPVQNAVNVWRPAIHSMRERASINKNSGSKLALVDLEENLEDDLEKEDLDKDALNKNANSQRQPGSLVDQEEKKTKAGKEEKRDNKLSWANIVREHQFQEKAFSETVSMQGLAPIFDPRSSLKRKLVWFAIVFTAVIFTAFNIYTQILMYADTPITVRVDFTKAKTFQFPVITVCNNNFASLSYARSFHGVATIEAVKPMLFETNSSSPDFSGHDFSFHRTFGWEPFYTNLAQNMTDMLKLCQWEQNDCNITSLTPVFTDMGLCYSFNLNGSLRAREAGRSYGLKLTLDAKQADYLRSMDHYYGAGFRVVVHAPGVPPIMSEKGIAVSAGFHNFLAIDMKQLINAHPSISECGSTPLKYYSSIYSTEACRLECRTDVISDKCGCRDTYMPNSDVRICDPPEFHECLYPALDEYLKEDNLCEDLCPEPCFENLYRVTPSLNPFSAHFLQEFTEEQGHNASYWRDNLVRLQIYLVSMTYEKEGNPDSSVSDIPFVVGKRRDIPNNGVREGGKPR